MVQITSPGLARFACGSPDLIEWPPAGGGLRWDLDERKADAGGVGAGRRRRGRQLGRRVVAASRGPRAGGRRRVPLPQAGQVIGGKYRIEEQLGKGGMGAVYRRHARGQRQVGRAQVDAAGRPSTSARASASCARRAPRAASITRTWSTSTTSARTAKRGYLVMELLRGESLRATPRARAARADRGRATLLLPAMRGVAAAHAQA